MNHPRLYNHHEEITDENGISFPPSFPLVDSNLFLRRNVNKTVGVLDSVPIREQALEEERASINITIPYTEKQLRQVVNRGLPISTVATTKSRREFYESDPEWKTYAFPLIMDAFSYCENETLMVEVLLNRRYLEREESWVGHEWSCTHNNISVNSMYLPETPLHVIINVFPFPGQCKNAENQQYEMTDNTFNKSYFFNVEFLSNFTRQQYYISACTMIEEIPISVVRMFIHHYFFHGVEHFVFYVNGLLDRWKRFLAPYASKGLVELVEFTFPKHGLFLEQDIMLSSCARRYRYHSQFMIFNDVDEYFHPMNSTWRVIDVVHLYDKVYPGVDAFSVRYMIQV